MKPPSMAPFLALTWVSLVERGRELGYSFALHGTLERDLDIVAIPWTEEAVPAEELARAVAEMIGWRKISDDGLAIQRTEELLMHGPGIKPHGRLTWTILYGSTWIDLSVMPRKS